MGIDAAAFVSSPIKLTIMASKKATPYVQDTANQNAFQELTQGSINFEVKDCNRHCHKTNYSKFYRTVKTVILFKIN